MPLGYTLRTPISPREYRADDRQAELISDFIDRWWTFSSSPGTLEEMSEALGIRLLAREGEKRHYATAIWSKKGRISSVIQLIEYRLMPHDANMSSISFAFWGALRIRGARKSTGHCKIASG